MPISIGRAGTERGYRSAGPRGVADGETSDYRTAHLSPSPPVLVWARLADLPETSDHRRAIQQAADRIAEWLPKGVHFDWERSFKNKGKFPATMTKEAARNLVAGLLRNALLAIYPNGRDDLPFAEQFRVVVEADRVIGTRGQRRVRIVLVRDPDGFLVENAFPVHER